MLFSLTALLAATAATVSASPFRRGQTVSVTPHAQYSSSVGVLGCKINTNRVAYWPGSVSCNDFCVRVSHAGRSLVLLKIDSSGGAHDISYDAWNYLGFGRSAKEDPRQGGGINMEYEFVNPEECRPLLHTGRLPLTAANSMNFVASCLNDPNSWVARNHDLFNFVDPLCKYGWDETCSLNLAVSNQPSCPHTLGETRTPTGQHVIDLEYGTGRDIYAS